MSDQPWNRLRSPPALQWPFLESDTYSFLIDICQKYWHFDLLASYGPGRRCVVLGTAVWTIDFKKMVIGEPEKKYILKIYLLSAYWIVLQLNFQWHIYAYGQFFIFQLYRFLARNQQNICKTRRNEMRRWMTKIEKYKIGLGFKDWSISWSATEVSCSVYFFSVIWTFKTGRHEGKKKTWSWSVTIFKT